MALLNVLVFILIFILAMTCLLAIFSPDDYYDAAEDDEQQQYIMRWNRDHDKNKKNR